MSLLTGPSAVLAMAASSTTPETSMAALLAAATALATVVLRVPGAVLLQRTQRLLWLLLGGVFLLLMQGAWHVWRSRTVHRLRRKLLFELAVTVLGPSGNGLLLMVLWPGWLVLAAGLLAARLCGAW